MQKYKKKSQKDFKKAKMQKGFLKAKNTFKKGKILLKAKKLQDLLRPVWTKNIRSYVTAGLFKKFLVPDLCGDIQTGFTII